MEEIRVRIYAVSNDERDYLFDICLSQRAYDTEDILTGIVYEILTEQFSVPVGSVSVMYDIARDACYFISHIGDGQFARAGAGVVALTKLLYAAYLRETEETNKNNVN